MAVIFNVLPAANQRASSVRRPAGLGFGGLRVMFTLHAVEQLDSLDLGAGELSDIARPSNVSTANVSSVLNTLERSDMIARVRSAIAISTLCSNELAGHVAQVAAHRAAIRVAPTHGGSSGGAWVWMPSVAALGGRQAP